MTSTLSVTRPVIRICSSASLASDAGELIVIFGASTSPRRSGATGVGTGAGGGVARGAGGMGVGNAACGWGTADGAGVGGADGGAAMTGGAGGRAAPASPQLSPLRLLSAFTNRWTSGAYQRKTWPNC